MNSEGEERILGSWLEDLIAEACEDVKKEEV